LKKRFFKKRKGKNEHKIEKAFFFRHFLHHLNSKGTCKRNQGKDGVWTQCNPRSLR
jgi:hypothetical protein